MTTTLITGANKGLGFETARRLIAAGHTVYVGSRDAERGRQAADRLGARLLLIDVTDDESVAAAAKAVEADGGLDVRVSHAFLPLLRQSAAPVIVNVSSGLGSLAQLTSPGTPAFGYPGVAYPA